jgi:hypothetical protein
MTLDFTKVASQIGNMVGKLKDHGGEHEHHLKCALDALCDQSVDLEKLKFKIINSRTPWPVAGLVDGLSQRISAPSCPAEYTAWATDGSDIGVDRHKSARCYLINVGTVSLHYGANPAADLNNYPHLYSDEEDLVIRKEGNHHREQQIEGTLLENKRSSEEIQKLAEIASSSLPGSDNIALMDGSLVLWNLEAFPDFVSEALLNKGFLPHLDTIKRLNQDRQVSLASYISLPRSNDVASALKVSLCPHQQPDCDKYCSDDSGACDAVSDIPDRVLFAGLLAPGERTALFINPSVIVKKRYGVHQVYFFYLRIEDEIARVEVPEWVGFNPDLLNLTHALTLDQCRRGQGYPIALSEAHEKAVITGADREEFWELVDSTLIGEKLPTSTSIKSQSKRTRWI